MKRILFFFFTVTLFAGLQFGEAGLNDGPYLFWQENSAEMLWIENGILRDSLLQFSEQSIQTFQLDFSEYTYRLQLESPQPAEAEFDDVSKFFAISDVHGQFSLMTELLQAHDVIDENQNWKFEDGHLIVLGDIFDRGPQVTECLWLIHQLEWQAEKVGGHVHFLLGNHEIMVLQGDMRYVHETYFERTEKIVEKNLNALYAENTEFGRWLRSKNTILKVNDFLFVHGGISPEIVEKELSINEINQLVRDKITKKEERNETKKLIFGNKGPFWFRGIWQSHPAYSQLDLNKLEEIFSFFQCEKMIVGHTTMDSVVTTFDKQVIGIDSGIKRGQNGEALYYSIGIFYRAFLNGEKKKM